MSVRLALRHHLDASAVLVVVGLLWVGRSALDSFQLKGAIGGPLLVLTAVLWRWVRGRDVRIYVAAALLSLAYATSSVTLIGFRADTTSYFVYLRSVAFDLDLDFRNDLAALGAISEEDALGPIRENVFSVGPAVLWSPFYAAAHAYVRLDGLVGRPFFEPDGYSLPYLRSIAVGTLTVVVVGSLLLFLLVKELTRDSIALLSVLGAVFASPVLYYAFVVPAMAHGVTFGVSGAFLWLWQRTRSSPSVWNWVLLGFVFGLLCMCRWQAAVYGSMLIPLAAQGLRSRSVSTKWLVLGAIAAVIAFSPQLIVWKLQFDEWVLIPQGPTFLDLSSPNWHRTLFAANHGLFTWTPLMLIGALGLLGGFAKIRRCVARASPWSRPPLGSTGACRLTTGREATRSARGATRWWFRFLRSALPSRSSTPRRWSDVGPFLLRPRS